MKRNLFVSDYRIKYSTITLSMIFVYVILYEWGIFEVVPNSIIYPLKMIIPALLLLFPIRKVIKDNNYFNNFTLCYFLFILWGLVPSLFGGNPEESVEQWLKFISRFVFFIVVARFLIVRRDASIIVMKAFVITGLFSFVQYLLVWFFQLTDLFSFSTQEIGRGIYYGPFGILGNVGSAMSFPGIPELYRFHGFWLEPSRASGFMFACYFIANNLYYLESKQIWKKSAYISLIAGFLCFSNAGYLAIALALLFGVLINLLNGKISLTNFSFKVGTVFLLIFLAIFGRTYVANNFIDVDIARAIVGVRGGSCTGTTCGGVNYSVNPADGRLAIYNKNINIATNYPNGIGIRVTGKYDKQTTYRNSGGNALLEWLIYTGFIGLFLLIIRELQVFIYSYRYANKDPSVLFLAQAWIAMFIQNMLYGNLMTPAYLIIIALMFSTKSEFVNSRK